MGLKQKEQDSQICPRAKSTEEQGRLWMETNGLGFRERRILTAEKGDLSGCRAGWECPLRISSSFLIWASPGTLQGWLCAPEGPALSQRVEGHQWPQGTCWP